MAKRYIVPSRHEEMIRDYPIAGLVPGWYFRFREVSNAELLVEGRDIYGRVISRHSVSDGASPLDEVVEDARRIVYRTNSSMETISSIIEALERAPSVVIPLVRAVPAVLLKRRPAPGKWSAHEHACHLAVAHGLFFSRLDEMLTVPEPAFTQYDPGTDDPDDALLQMDLEESLRNYAADRARLVARLRLLSESDWNRTATHSEYSHYSVFIMFRHLALHDFLHAYRIQKLLLRKEWAAE